MFQSGLMQSPYGLRMATFSRENTAIVTGDRALNALHGLIQSAIPWGGRGQADALTLKLADGSEILKMQKQDEIQKILGISARNSKHLVTSDVLLEIALDLMDEFKDQ